MQLNCTAMDKSLMLNQIKEHLNIKKDVDFAEYLGIKNTTLSAWRTRNAIDERLLYEKCSFLAYGWLMTGEGSMFKESIEHDKFVEEMKVINISTNEKVDDEIMKMKMESLERELKDKERIIEEKERLIQILLGNETKKGKSIY